MSILTVNKKGKIMKNALVEWKKKYLSNRPREIILGENTLEKIKFDFAVTPHWIIAGEVGRGKTITLRHIAFQCVLKKYRTIIVDFNSDETFSGIFKDFCQVITNKNECIDVLQQLAEENARRLDIFRDTCCKNIDDYNRRFSDKQMERIVVLIDECDILLMSTREKEDKDLTALGTAALEKLATLAKAAGINIVICIQWPDETILTSRIRHTFSGRLCGYFHDAEASLRILGNTAAAELPNVGTGWFILQDSCTSFMFQTYYITTSEMVQMLNENREMDKGKACTKPANVTEVISYLMARYEEAKRGAK